MCVCVCVCVWLGVCVGREGVKGGVMQGPGIIEKRCVCIYSERGSMASERSVTRVSGLVSSPLLLESCTSAVTCVQTTGIGLHYVLSFFLTTICMLPLCKPLQTYRVLDS